MRVYPLYGAVAALLLRITCRGWWRGMVRIRDRYEYDPAKDLLGKGGFARVFRAHDTLLNREVALKVFSQSGNDQYSVLSEIRKAIQLEHPNLLRYYDVVLLEQANALGETEELQIGVMEYANAGDLKGFARANPGSPLLPKFLRQVLHGLEYLHAHGIIHRDLKAQNILLVERNGELTAKISDFGISKNLASGDTRSSSMLVGTIEYMAPEQFNPKKFGVNGKIQSNVDLWGYGVMVHELLTDATPFGKRGADTTAEQIMSAILAPELPAEIDSLSEPYRTVVKRCLVANAKDRIQKASELLGFFGEPGFEAFAPGARSPAPEDTQPIARPPVADDATQFIAPAGGGSGGADDGTAFYSANVPPPPEAGTGPIFIKSVDEAEFAAPDEGPAKSGLPKWLLPAGLIVAALIAIGLWLGGGGGDGPQAVPTDLASESSGSALDAAKPDKTDKTDKTDKAKPKPEAEPVKAVAAPEKEKAKVCREVCTDVEQPVQGGRSRTASVSAGEISYPSSGSIPQGKAADAARRACGSGSMVSYSAVPDGQCGGNICFARVSATCSYTDGPTSRTVRQCKQVCN